jgi:hypothetical protein
VVGVGKGRGNSQAEQERKQYIHCGVLYQKPWRLGALAYELSSLWRRRTTVWAEASLVFARDVRFCLEIARVWLW